MVARFDAESGKLRPSTFTLNGKQYSNMTLINLALRELGPMNEGTLTLLLLCFQAVCCVCALVLRYHVSFQLYGTL